MEMNQKQFSPRRFSAGVIGIPLLAVVFDMLLRFFVTQYVVFSKGGDLFWEHVGGTVDLREQIIALIEENFHLISIIYSILQIVLFVVIFRLCRKRATPYVFTKMPQPFVWPLLPVLVLAGIGITTLWSHLVEVLAGASSYWQDVIEQYEVVGASLATKDSYLLQFLSVVVFVPIAEELLFRGILLSELKQVIKAEWAAFLSAVAFGIFHANVFQGVYAFLLGFLIGLVYVWTESIWAAIVMHMLFNFYGGSLLDLLEISADGLFFYHWYNLLPLLMLFVAIPVVIYLYQHRRPALTVTRHSRYAYAQQALDLIAAEGELQKIDNLDNNSTEGGA